MMEVPAIPHDEMSAYASVLGSAETEEGFVAAFAAFIEFLAERIAWPYEVAAAFVRGMIEGRAVVDDLPSLEEFVSTFAVYAKGVLLREADPHAIGALAYRMVHDTPGACREAIDKLMLHRAGAMA